MIIIIVYGLLLKPQLFFSAQELCQIFLATWSITIESINSIGELRNIVTKMIHQELRAISHQFFFMKNIDSFINAIDWPEHRGNDTVLLSVITKYKEWIKILQKCCRVFIDRLIKIILIRV